MENILLHYERLIGLYAGEADVLAARIRRYGLYRILFFLFWVVSIYLSTLWPWWAPATIAFLGALCFAWLVNRHSAMHRRKKVLEHLLSINREECDSLSWEFSAKADGNEYLDPQGLFAHDLDIFGPGSLYQYINRCSTLPGRDRLAGMLSTIEQSAGEIRQRQEAITEMKNKFGWRQGFRVEGLMAGEETEDIRSLVSWVNAPRDFRSKIFPLLVVVMPLLTLVVFLLSVAGLIAWWHFMIYLLIPLAVSGIRHRKVNVKHQMLSRKFPLLKKFSRLMELVEEEDFASERMRALQARLRADGDTASRAIRRLAGIAGAFDTRLNLLAGFLMNILFLWDIRQSLRLERWQKKYRRMLPRWFDTLGEADAFVSLAGYSDNNPSYVMPVIMEGESLHFNAAGLGHPLIPEVKRVCNDYSVPGWRHFTILTGANMAGKSTFLRTVGVNMLLGSCGAPVCAASMEFTPVTLVTSIHTADSLAHNESYFYAELKRLKLIIDMLKGGEKVFIILDEILKGTNSNDKQSGSKALIRQLIALQASGIIATHDLALGELEQQFPGSVRNLCFEIIIDGHRLDYDYRIREGIARNMNATILMERMGITVGGEG